MKSIQLSMIFLLMPMLLIHEESGKTIALMNYISTYICEKYINWDNGYKITFMYYM